LPELPEVETVRKGLEKLLNNFYIERIEVLKERSIILKLICLFEKISIRKIKK